MVGHTDAVGSEDDNLSLADRRASAVAEILTDQFDVPPENLITQGYGEQYLKVDTQGPERLNRRVTVLNITRLMAER
jgi:outer membrane protein OmpA-like peptidoglycan-associated protein